MKYTNLDISNCSVKEIDLEIVRLEKLANDYNNSQMSIKIQLNSVYGALASPFFIGYNSDIAEAITLQGQDIIKYVGHTVNKYFLEFWHKDKKVHQELNIIVHSKNNNEVWIYCDTDSIFLCFQEVINNCNWQNEPYELIQKIYDIRLKSVIENALNKYALKWNTENIQNLALELISESDLLLAKKKYILDIKWEAPGIIYDSHSKIKAKGVELVQSSTPLFSRKYIKEILKEIFTKKKNLDIKEFLIQLRKYKTEFCASELDNITLQMGVGDYSKGIANDKEKFEVNDRCPIHVRGAGYHNYLLNQNPKLKKKYSLLKSGDKVKFYYTTDKYCNIFSYAPGRFPFEIAPSIDYDAQFERVFLDAISRLIEPMGFPTLKANLTISKNLF